VACVMAGLPAAALRPGGRRGRAPRHAAGGEPYPLGRAPAAIDPSSPKDAEDRTMRHLRVLWHHDHDDEPVEIYSELDDEGYEVRKVEVFRNGRHDHADAGTSTGRTGSAEVPIPGIEEIAELDEFTPMWVTAEEFEAVWRKAIASH